MASNSDSKLDHGGKYHGFHHIEFLVGNAFQAATFYVARFGFKRVAYRGLETGSREIATHVVRSENIIFAFSSLLTSKTPKRSEILAKSGDGACCVCFEVSDCKSIFDKAVERGADVVHQLETSKLYPDKDDSPWVRTASIKTYGDTIHTFLEKSSNYPSDTHFLPGYQLVNDNDPFEKLTEPVKLQFIDHIVGNQPDQQMNPVAEWYEKVLHFHRFWSVDDSMIHTEYSSLRSIVVTDNDEKVKMPINEPANGKRKSQIQEYVDYYGGAGVQHIAMNTPDIIHSVTALRKRGVNFLEVPDTYYEQLREKLKTASIKIDEDLDTLQKLKILIDYDENGYLLQLFTKPVEDRPTLFYEVIQRHNHSGFGAGNFKSLFEAIEREQEKRGNL